MSGTAQMGWRNSAWWRRQLHNLNRELWLVLAIFAIGLVLNFLLASGRMVLAFYTLPAIFSAYLYGRRHAVLTAFASAFLVILLTIWNPTILAGRMQMPAEDKWFDITVWGGTLVVSAFLMGTLYDRKEAHLRDLRSSYKGVLMMLQNIATDNMHAQNHPFRVAIMATKVAEEMGLEIQKIEDIYSAAMLHEIDKAGISWDMLYQTASLSREGVEEIEKKLRQGAVAATPGESSLRRIIRIILGYWVALDCAEKSQAPVGPLESRILLVTDTYDSLTSALRVRISPSEAMERIAQRAGIEYDVDVVNGMVRVFRKRGMDRLEPGCGLDDWETSPERFLDWAKTS